MRKRRRTKYTWLPSYGTGITVAGVGNFEQSARYGSLAVRRDNVSATGVIACIPDAAPENFDGSSTLPEAITQEYILRRIVGKLHLFYKQDSRGWQGGNPPIPEGVYVTAGFFIAREENVDAAAGETTPIGYTNGINPTDFNNYSSMSRDTQREPWIWRRAWCLGNNKDSMFQVADQQSDGYQLLPPNNYTGSVLDGPHIDCKTVRRVNQDDRLWFSLSTLQLTSSALPNDNGYLEYILDVRYLGALRKARQRGSF